MPTSQDGNRPRSRSPEEEEYRRHQEAKARRRKKKRMQKILLIGAFIVAAVLLILCIVMIFRAIFGGDKTSGTSSSASASSITSDASAGVPGITWPVATDPTVWSLLLINPQTPQPDGFDPELTPVSPIGYMFDSRAAEPLKQMIADCNAVEGNSLEIDSAYRGPDTQNKKYNDLVAYYTAHPEELKEGETPESRAKQTDPPYGYSDHQTALGVDFKTGAYQQVDAGFAQTPEFAWLMEHCTEYGFILRFPENKTAITGIEYQPYHFRYVGSTDAAIIMQAGICLEEYLMALPAATDSGPDTDASSSLPVAAALPLWPAAACLRKVGRVRL